eukprot:7383504-Prymnesium_polylepis.1
MLSCTRASPAPETSTPCKTGGGSASEDDVPSQSARAQTACKHAPREARRKHPEGTRRPRQMAAVSPCRHRAQTRRCSSAVHHPGLQDGPRYHCAQGVVAASPSRGHRCRHPSPVRSSGRPGHTAGLKCAACRTARQLARRTHMLIPAATRHRAASRQQGAVQPASPSSAPPHLHLQATRRLRPPGCAPQIRLHVEHTPRASRDSLKPAAARRRLRASQRSSGAATSSSTRLTSQDSQRRGR